MSDRLVRALEDRLPHPEAYPTGARGPELSARLGAAAGAAFAVCFVTGLLSHALQHREPVVLPPLPPWGYALSQGVHVTSGVVAIPLLAVKIWSVAPRSMRKNMSSPRGVWMTIIEAKKAVVNRVKAWLA